MVNMSAFSQPTHRQETNNAVYLVYYKRTPFQEILNQSKKERGVATLCIGGGLGYSVVFERAS
jgi:hypothetical protein